MFLIMLAEPDISVKRFFERPDIEKQFLYQLLLQKENPVEAMKNFRECLKRVNSADIMYHYAVVNLKTQENVDAK